MHCRLYIECWDHHRDVNETTEPPGRNGRGDARSTISRVFATAREADQVAQQIKRANADAGIYCAVIRRSLHTLASLRRSKAV